MNKIRTALLLGDSLTDGERHKDPSGLGRAWPAAALRLIRESGLAPLQLVNRAVGGSRSVEVLKAWEERELPSPDLLVVMVGANDLWRRYVPWLDHAPVTPQEYGRNLAQLLYAAQEAGIEELHVCTPAGLHEAPEHPWNRELEEYRGWCREIADACGALLVPTGEEWMEAVRAHPEVRWTFDGVHPRPVGYERLARTWLHHALGAPALAPGILPARPSDLRNGAWP